MLVDVCLNSSRFHLEQLLIATTVISARSDPRCTFCDFAVLMMTSPSRDGRRGGRGGGPLSCKCLSDVCSSKRGGVKSRMFHFSATGSHLKDRSQTLEALELTPRPPLLPFKLLFWTSLACGSFFLDCRRQGGAAFAGVLLWETCV